MFDRAMLYQIIYALAATGGREKALFGSCAPAALEAFERSLPANAFPELWFELPLMGDPWFDLHALTAREDLEPGMSFDARTSGGYPKVFEWFAAQSAAARQLALSWDVGAGKMERPAVQLLLRTTAPEVTCEFLGVAGRSDAATAYRTFVGRIPSGWFACYTGVFPDRLGENIRVECVLDRRLQSAYAKDASLLEAHLRQVGLSNLGDTIVERCQILARTPSALEFQFDVTAEGTADTTFGASVRFNPSVDAKNEGLAQFDPNGAAGELMERVESWGLADDRWRLLADTIYSKSVSFGGARTMVWCYPTFIKLRWRDGEPLDAKAYLMAGAQ